MLPRILLGAPVGSSTRLSTAQLLASAPPADWSNETAVSRPTLNVFQVRNARGAVWAISTSVLPSSTVWTGWPALIQGWPGAVSSPPGDSPLGTLLGAAWAAARAASWLAWYLRIASSAPRS